MNRKIFCVIKLELNFQVYIETGVFLCFVAIFLLINAIKKVFCRSNFTNLCILFRAIIYSLVYVSTLKVLRVALQIKVERNSTPPCATF